MPRSSPWCVFSLSAKSNRDKLFKYRCVPGDLWLEVIEMYSPLKYTISPSGGWGVRGGRGCGGGGGNRFPK